ncbi:MAG: hypothetical protein ABL986_21590 [Vicinamibacterales bacterium]
MLVEVRPVGALGHAIEVREQINLRPCRLGLRALGLPQKVVDQHLRVQLLLDVERWRLGDEVAPVLIVLSTPDELRVQVSVSGIPDFLARSVHGLEHRLVLGGRNVDALVVGVAESLDVLWGLRTLGHFSPPSRRRVPGQPTPC